MDQVAGVALRRKAKEGGEFVAHFQVGQLRRTPDEERLVDFVDAAVGPVRGSRGLTTIGAAVIFGATSGASAATIGTVGKVMYPALVKSGDTVTTGQTIGYVGRTGDATACHLHFELWPAPGWYTGGQPVDPLPTLQAWDAGG